MQIKLKELQQVRIKPRRVLNHYELVQRLYLAYMFCSNCIFMQERNQIKTEPNKATDANWIAGFRRLESHLSIRLVETLHVQISSFNDVPNLSMRNVILFHTGVACNLFTFSRVNSYRFNFVPLSQLELSYSQNCAAARYEQISD